MCLLFLGIGFASLLIETAQAQSDDACAQIERLDPSEYRKIDALGQQCAQALPSMSPADQERHIRFYSRENPSYLGTKEFDPLGSQLSPEARRMLMSFASMRKAIVGELDMADADQLITVSTEANDLVALSHLHYAIAIQTSREGGSNDVMEQHLRTSLRFAEASNLVRKYPHIYNALAVRARLDGEYHLAIELYHQALQAFEDIGQFDNSGAVLANMGNIFIIIGDSKEAARFHERAIANYERYGKAEPYLLATFYSNLGWAYKEDRQLDQSDQAYLRAKEYAELENSEFFRGQIGLGHAETLYLMGDIDAAIDMTKYAAPVVLELGDPVEGANGMLRLAGYYLEKNEITKAQESLNVARTVLEPNNGGVEEVESLSGDAELKGEYVRLTAELLTRLGRPSEAAPYFQAASRYNDIRFEEAKMKAVANSEILFEIRERDSMLEKLEADAALAASELRRSRLVIGLALAIALLIGTVAYASYRSYRLQKALVKTRDVFLQEIHHRTGNNLQMMASLIRSEARNRSIFAKNASMTNAANRIRAMGLIHNYLYNSDAEPITVVRPETFLVELLDLLDEGLGQDDIKLFHEITPCTVDVAVATPLALLVCELVTNAYKHAFPNGGGTIKVSLSPTEDGLCLTVSDNGQGFDRREALDKPGSQGMQIIEDLTDQIGGQLNLTSAADGTIWTINGIKSDAS
jgi:two-component sensor histidine kinase